MKIKIVVEQEDKGEKKETDITPHVKDVLTILAGSGALVAFAVAPGLTYLLPKKQYYRYQETNDREWKRFNARLLRKEIKRLQENKDLVVLYKQGVPFIKLTKKGLIRAYKFNMADMALNPPKKWDGKWRLIIYDIPKENKGLREEVRHLLKKMKILQMQKSVYLTPHPCEKEIGLIRDYLNIGKYVRVLTVSGLEDEKAYRDYFGV